MECPWSSWESLDKPVHAAVEGVCWAQEQGRADVSASPILAAVARFLVPFLLFLFSPGSTEGDNGM